MQLVGGRAWKTPQSARTLCSPWGQVACSRSGHQRVRFLSSPTSCFLSPTSATRSPGSLASQRGSSCPVTRSRFISDVARVTHTTKHHTFIATTYEERTPRSKSISGWAEDLGTHSSKEARQMANRHVKRCSVSRVTRGMTHPLTPIRTAIVKHVLARTWGKGSCVPCWWDCRRGGRPGEQHGGSSERAIYHSPLKVTEVRTHKSK